MKHFLSKPCKKAVLKYLFDNDLTNCPYEFDTELENLMDKNYYLFNSVKLNPDIQQFMALCKDFGVNPGEKQIEISADEIAFTPDNRIIYKPDTV